MYKDGAEGGSFELCTVHRVGEKRRTVGLCDSKLTVGHISLKINVSFEKKNV